MIVPCNEEVEMLVCEQLCMQDPDFQLDGILKLMPRLDKGINAVGGCVGK
jgi:hypothetical protein